jgi:hypothetical protein
MSALGARCHQAETHRTGLGWAVSLSLSLSRVGYIGYNDLDGSDGRSQCSAR